MTTPIPSDSLKSTNLATARAFAAAGCAVFPCDPQTEQPRVAWTERSTADPGVLKGFWQCHPDALPAIDLAKAGLLVVEALSDSAAGDGPDSFRQIAAAHDWTVDPPAVRSPGALHFYFRQREGEPLASDASLRGYGINIRGNGGYAIPAGAVRGDGAQWVSAGDVDLRDALARQSVPVVPEWLVALIRRARELASGPGNGARRPLADLFDRPAVASPPPVHEIGDQDGDRPHKVADEPDPARWQAPDLSYLGSGRTPPPVFPLDALGEVWGPWCAAHAQARNAPVDYVAGTLLAVTAAMIGNRRWPCASSEWREPPILWVALVGAPSSGKSPAQEPVLDLVRAVQRETDTRLLISGTSPSSLGQAMSRHPAGVLLHREELGGWLGKLNRHAGNDGAREMWLASYAGRPYRIDRHEDAEPLDTHLTVGILGSMAPDRLARVLQGASDGLAARFLWCWPEPAAGCVLARTPIDNARQLAALRRIYALDMPTAGDGGAPGRLALSEPAAEVFEAFVCAIRERALASLGGTGDLLRKAPGHCLRLAATLTFLDWSLAPSGEPPARIERMHIERAVRLLERYFLPMARRAFGEAAIPPHELHAMTLARWLRERRAKSFNARDASRRIVGGLRDAAHMARACATLVDAGLIRSRSRGSRGRPRGDFEVNPAILVPAGSPR